MRPYVVRDGPSKSPLSDNEAGTMTQARFRTRELLLVVVIVALALALFTQHRRALVARQEAEQARYELLDREDMLRERLEEVENERAWLNEELENVELELRDLGYEWNRDPFSPRTRPITDLGQQGAEPEAEAP